MSDVRSASGFRSLVEQIQENDGGADPRPRPQRRRLTLPAGAPERLSPAGSATSERAAIERTAADPAPTKPASAASVRLLQRRWL